MKIVKTETQDHRLGELGRTETQLKRPSIFSGPPKFGKFNTPILFFPQGPGRESEANKIIEPNDAEHFEFSPLRPTNLKNGSKSPSDKTRLTILGTPSVKSLRKNSRHETPKKLIQDQQAIFLDQLESDVKITPPHVDALDQFVNGQSPNKKSHGSTPTTMGDPSIEHLPKTMTDRASM